MLLKVTVALVYNWLKGMDSVMFTVANAIGVYELYLERAGSTYLDETACCRLLHWRIRISRRHRCRDSCQAPQIAWAVSQNMESIVQVLVCYFSLDPATENCWELVFQSVSDGYCVPTWQARKYIDILGWAKPAAKQKHQEAFGNDLVVIATSWIVIDSLRQQLGTQHGHRRLFRFLFSRHSILLT